MSESGGLFEKLAGKAESAAEKFMENPQDVDKAKAKAEGMLEKYMDPEQAHEVVDETASLIEKEVPESNRP